MKYSLLVLFLLGYCSLYGQKKPVLVVSSGHHSTLMCVDISPNGKHVASGGADNMVKIYDMQLQQELNTFTEHSGQVMSVQFSKDNKYIVSASANELIVHSHPEGELVQRFEIDELSTDDFYYFTSDLKLIFGNDRTGLAVYNALTGVLEKTYADIKVDKFEILPDESMLITTGYVDGKPGVEFYSFPEGVKTDFIPMDGLFMQRYKSSRDGKTIAFEYSVCQVAIMDVKTKEIKSKINGGVGMLNIMEISPDGKQLITSTFDNFIRYWDVNSGKEIRSIADISPSGGAISMALAIKDMDVSDDGKMAVFCYSDLMDGKQSFTVEWFEYKSMKSIGKHAGDVKLSLSISVDHSGKVLSTGTVDAEMGVKCFDIAKGSQKAFIPGIAYHDVGGEYLTATVFDYEKSKPQLNIYSMPAVRKIKSIDVHSFGEISMSPSGQYVTIVDVLPPPNGDYTKGAVTPIARVFDVSTGDEIVHLERTLETMPKKCMFPPDETKMFLIYPNSIETVDLSSGKVVNTVEAKLNLSYSCDVSPDGTKIVCSSPDGEIYGCDVTTGEKEVLIKFDQLTIPVGLSFSPDNSLIGVAVMALTQDKPHRVLVYDWLTKTKVCELLGHTTLISQLVIGPKNKHLYSVDNNGIIAMWDINKCKAKASFLAFGAEDYIITTPDGYYKSSKGNVAKIGFRQEGGLYTFDQFDLRYNRPDKVLANIGMASEKQIEMYTKAYVKRLKRMGFSEENFSESVHAPEIEILESETLPLNTTASSIDLGIKASDASLAIDRLNVVVNGIPIYGKLGRSLKSDNKKTFEEKIRISLVAGVNLIQVSAMNIDGTESVRKSYSIDCKKQAVKPDLYIVALGVKSYNDSTMNLTYSDKDVADLVDMFEKNQGNSGLYNKVYVQKLTNNEVIKENVTATKDMLMRSKVDDHVVLFYSGHGLLDEEMDYFLSTYDVDFASPSARGLPFENFRDLIDGVAARNRLILVDACHSGEVDKDEVEHAEPDEQEDLALSTKGFAAKGKKIVGLGNSFELMKELFVELRKESGATIIASSAGKEFSLESKEWKNGVFTFVLKEAMLNKMADSDDEDSNVSVSELKRYLFVRVKELTNGQQTPTVRRENLQHDYLLY